MKKKQKKKNVLSIRCTKKEKKTSICPNDFRIILKVCQKGIIMIRLSLKVLLKFFDSVVVLQL